MKDFFKDFGRNFEKKSLGFFRGKRNFVLRDVFRSFSAFLFLDQFFSAAKEKVDFVVAVAVFEKQGLGGKDSFSKNKKVRLLKSDTTL